MANANINLKSQTFGIAGALGSALSWIWNGLIYLGENSAKARVLRAINDMSDEELAKRGVTRADMVRRLMSDGFTL